MSPKPKGGFHQDNAAWQRLHAAKKAATKNEAVKTSWWATPNLSREDFASRAALRHREILNSASDGTRSINRAI